MGTSPTPAELEPYFEEADPQVATDGLIELANRKGGKDNITAVLVRLGEGDAKDSVRARRLALKRELLLKMPLFARLNERELLRVMQVAEVIAYKAERSVVREGDRGDELFIVLSGVVRIHKGEMVLLEIGPGDHFGEMALIRAAPRSATVTAGRRASSSPSAAPTSSRSCARSTSSPSSSSGSSSASSPIGSTRPRATSPPPGKSWRRKTSATPSSPTPTSMSPARARTSAGLEPTIARRRALLPETPLPAPPRPSRRARPPSQLGRGGPGPRRPSATPRGGLSAPARTLRP